jgi:hypothetical protein
VRRTRAGLAGAVVFAVAAGWFGVDASNQKGRAVAAAAEAAEQTARAQAYVAQIDNNNGRYFEAARAALAGLTNPLTLDSDPSQAAPWGELVRATAADGFLVPPLQHDGEVHAATFDAKGEHVVTASYDKTARIWDARTGAPIGKPLQHDGWVYAATFDAEGERVVTASDDKSQTHRGRQGAISITRGAVGRQHQQHRALDARRTRRACRCRARSNPNTDSRRQGPRQGPRKAHGPTPFPHPGTKERGHQAALAGRDAR